MLVYGKKAKQKMEKYGKSLLVILDRTLLVFSQYLDNRSCKQSFSSIQRTAQTSMKLITEKPQCL